MREGVRLKIGNETGGGIGEVNERGDEIEERE